MSRINTVNRSRTPGLKCGKCNTLIPKGAAYRWTKPRYGSRKVRCMSPVCGFKPSDLSSAKSALVYDAIQDAEAAIATAVCVEDIEQALQDVADVAREVADEYQGASDQWAGGAGHPEYQERADTCNGFADNLEGWTPSGDSDEDNVRADAGDECEREEDETDEEYEQRKEEAQDDAWSAALEGLRDEAVDMLNGFDL